MMRIRVVLAGALLAIAGLGIALPAHSMTCAVADPTLDEIVCGTFRTDSFEYGMTPETEEQMTAGISLRRIASAEEIVGTALFLASDASSYLSGELLVLDGG